MNRHPHIYVALPVMDEPDSLPLTMQSIDSQGYRNFSVVVCVNQPDHWWNDPNRLPACLHNAESISLLYRITSFPVTVIDRSSPGHGWKGKKHGVGWARKTAMDAIDTNAESSDIILSLDADTRFSADYFTSIADTLACHPDATALAVPYYHQLPGSQEAARAILRYEIYMRYYLLNLMRIWSPYAFTALGSAMALPVWAYRKTGGMTPKLSGEDFYFLQKLRKAGEVICWNPEKSYPAARFSSRVFFGTGPAMIRGAGGDWSSYPIYPFRLFDEIGESCQRFPEMFSHPVDTPVTRFLSDLTGEEDPFHSIRKNSREVSQFVRACHEKFDGLRILQYLKIRQQKEGGSDEEHLNDWLQRFYPDAGCRMPDAGVGLVDDMRLEDLDAIRNFLARQEDKERMKRQVI